MTFSTVLYHEIRKAADFNPEYPSPIDVRQDYADLLPSALFVTLEQLEEEMEYLKENHFHTLTLQEIKAFYYQQNPLPEKSILLTFDDCFQSIKEYAYPILKKYGFHAVAFVVTGWLHDQTKPFDIDKSVCLTKSDLKEMEDVFEYANHTDKYHQRTNESTSMIMEVTDQQFADDLDLCNSFVAEQDVFAYPFGLFIDRNVSLLRTKGFQLAFTCEEHKNDQHTDPLLLNRYVVPHFLPLEEFKEMVD
ncbi:polysaccharide deacetylase family protein [Gracilibacillus timonensis]|uniref:polysaccharide deacetylase family protein n=1 Tax=Gracilibacillus timonensis TaxID=1816696 RepID=UPI00082599B2|nr:polysaccharide deacetylase family protein [Gracilibacillus timonensis]